MKKTLALLSLVTVLACEKSVVSDQPPIVNTNASNQSITYEDQVGKFTYNQIRLHSDVDPYSYVTTDQAIVLKKAFDALQTKGIKDLNLALDDASGSQSAKVSEALNSNLKQFNSNTLKYFEQLQTVDLQKIDKWFADQMNTTRIRSDINKADQATLLSTQSLVRYAVKARIESISTPDIVNDSRARTEIDFGCISQEAKCATNTILTYVGYGASLSATQGAVVGAIIGTLVSIGTCQCQANTRPCQYPTRVVIPASCVAPGSNLQVRLLGYGDGANGFQLEVWDTPDRQNRLTWPIQDGTNSNVFNIQASTLQNRHKIYLLPYTNCGTGDIKTSPSIVEVNLDQLAQPNVTLYGSTDAYVGNTYTYSINGSNFDFNTVRWSIFSTNVGTIVSQSAGSVQVRWTKPIGSPNAVYATVQNTCSPSSSPTQVSIGVTVH